MFHLHVCIMNVQSNYKVSFGYSKIPSLITDKELEGLFIKNNFYKNADGSFNKLISLKDAFCITKKTGTYAGDFAEVIRKPVTKETKDAFKGFLALGKTKEFITKNFLGLFAMFSILRNNDGLRFNCGEAIYSNYKNYSEMFRNIITNPPKKGSVLESFKQYKGLDCGKINGRLRGTYDLKDKKVDNEIKDLKKYIDTQVIKEPISLYRGEGTDILEKVKMRDGSTVNFAQMLLDATKDKEKTQKLNEFLLDHDVVATQPSFMSTTTNPFLAKDFGGGQIFWDLKTAPNTKACFIEPLQIKSPMYEDEVLVQAGSKIRIKEAKFDENQGIWFLRGEVFN